MRNHSFLLLAGLSVCLASTAAAQDLPKQARDRHEYDLIDVDWRVKIDMPRAALEGTVVNTLKTTKSDALLVFDCAGLNVKRVEVDGRETPFRADGNVLGVTAAGTNAGRTLKVAVEYGGAPEAGIYFVPASRSFPAHTDIVYTQGEMEDNRYWLPTYDSPNDKATSRGTIDVPAGWRVLSNGQSLGVKTAGGRSVWRWRQDKPTSTYLISLVAGPYTEAPDGTDPVPVSIWTPEGLEKWGRNAFGGTDAIIRFYGTLTGVKYPWRKYSQSAVADFMFGGMENVTCTTQTIHALFPDSVKSTRDSTGLDAHELAHQWFGDYVTTPSWDDIWINEGWASFLPHFWTREKYGQEEYDLDRYGTLEAAKGAMNGSPNRSMVWSGWKDPMDAFDGNAYAGGAARMFALMHLAGEGPFWRATRAYLKEYGLKNVDTAGFFRSYSRSLGRDLSTFEKQWFRTPSVAPVVEARREGGVVTLKQTQPIPFDLTLDVWSLQQDGTWLKKVVSMTGATVTIGGFGKGPILVDAEAYLPIEVKYPDATKEDLLRAWKAAPNAAAKMRLAKPLTDLLMPEERDGLVRGETPRMQRELMQYVSAPATLREFGRAADDRLRQAAYSRMGQVPADDGIEADLRAAWRDHALNPDLRMAALQSLYTLTKESSLLDEAWKEDRFDDGYRTWALDAWAQSDPNRARDLALQSFSGNSTGALRLTAVRKLGKVKDRPGERTVYDSLAAMLSERSNSPLRAAIGALADYGDPAAIPLLEKRANHGLHFIRNEVQSAIGRLKK
jgi:aminopeptidase N